MQPCQIQFLSVLRKSRYQSSVYQVLPSFTLSKANMSIARNLVDLYVLSSAVAKVGSCVIASQTSAACHHVKTSSILNPTIITKEQKPAPQTSAVEVPFPKVEEEASISIENETFTTNAKPEAPEPKTVSTKPTATTTAAAPEPVDELKAKVEHEFEPVSKPIETLETTSSISPQPTLTETPKIEPIVTTAKIEGKKRELKESRIPTSRFGRLWNYGTLATGMGMGAINETFRRATGLSQDNSGSDCRLLC